MTDKKDFPMNLEAEREHIQTRRKAQRIRNIRGQSNVESLLDEIPKDSKDPLLPLDYFTKRGEEECEASCKQKSENKGARLHVTIVFSVIFLMTFLAVASAIAYSSGG
ncbi:hypothetical protein MNBD_BACTEROID05-523 [hydrothermal vent metagenome]|uniref:Uncharacterized protein n=1 Tax=hydrothermal vent metagenome TaxID=652676 RepID=A0A3B0U8I3_9ZZZZ